MAFNNYSSLAKVIDRYKVHCVSGSAVAPCLDAPPFSDHFQSELAFNLQEFPIGRSEINIGELLIFPILREVWKPYRNELSLFSHESLEYDADLSGTPDYFVCKKSEFGSFYATPPFLIAIEAKLDDYTKAWGQCLAAMLAAQKLNGMPDKPIYGIATNGRGWDFGVLLGTMFTLDQNTIGLHKLDILRQALHGVFRACRDLALAHAPATATP